jgi:GR25 family glycosyltransferase involved in LPS biosynthesis
MINDFFDKVYCLNLDSRRDRWAECQQIFQQNNLDVERVSAVYGKDLNLPIEGIKPGAMGCSLSHYFIVKMAKQLGLKNVLILEDDIEFAPDLQDQFNEYVQQLPTDWHMLYLGGNHGIGFPLQPLTANLSQMRFSYTSHAVGLNHTIYDTVLQSIINLRAPVDVCYAHVQYNNNAFVFNPHLAWQRSSYSDVEQADVNYEFLKNHNQ